MSPPRTAAEEEGEDGDEDDDGVVESRDVHAGEPRGHRREADRQEIAPTAASAPARRMAVAGGISESAPIAAITPLRVRDMA